MSAITITNLTKGFRSERILNNLSVRLEAGKIHGIVGRNGTGKTVLLKCICGLIVPDKGTIMINGKIVDHTAKPSTDMGVIIEKPGFLPEYSGITNLRLLDALSGLPKRDNLPAILSRVGLENVGRKKVKHYSVGMRQRLGLAQAIMGNPTILLLDEPFSGLDVQGMQDMHSLFRELRKEGKTIVMTTHYAEDIHSICDECHLMENGSIRSLDVEQFR